MIISIRRALLIVVMSSTLAFAGRGENTDTPQATDSAVLNDTLANAQRNATAKLDERVWEWSEDHLSVAAGPAFFLGSQSTTAASVNVRVGLGAWENNRSPWAIEIGGNWPHSLASDFKMEQQTINGNTFLLNVNSIAEAHVAAHWEVPHGHQDILVPDLGFGVSALQIKDNIIIESPLIIPYYQSLEETKIALSPLFEVGLHVFMDHRFSFSLDAAYVSYANIPSYGPAFDLTLTGFILRPLFHVRF